VGICAESPRSEISLAEIRSTGVAGFHSKRLVTGRMNTVLGVRPAFPRHENHQRYECWPFPNHVNSLHSVVVWESREWTSS
jgi:hypothetical protein